MVELPDPDLEPGILPTEIRKLVERRKQVCSCFTSLDHEQIPVWGMGRKKKKKKKKKTVSAKKITARGVSRASQQVLSPRPLTAPCFPFAVYTRRISCFQFLFSFSPYTLSGNLSKIKNGFRVVFTAGARMFTET